MYDFPKTPEQKRKENRQMIVIGLFIFGLVPLTLLFYELIVGQTNTSINQSTTLQIKTINRDFIGHTVDYVCKNHGSSNPWFWLEDDLDDDALGTFFDCTDYESYIKPYQTLYVTEFIQPDGKYTYVANPIEIVRQKGVRLINE